MFLLRALGVVHPSNPDAVIRTVSQIRTRSSTPLRLYDCVTTAVGSRPHARGACARRPGGATDTTVPLSRTELALDGGRPRKCT